MIVTCPQCSKRYLVDDQALSHNRRQVRCGSCAYVWLYEPTREAPSLEALNNPPSFLKPLPPSLTEDPSDVPHVRSSSWGWAFYGCVWIALCASVVLCRDFFARQWPILRPVYEAVGLPLIQTETLELTNLRMHPIQPPPGKASADYILLQGDILNTGHDARSIPPFLIHLESERFPDVPPSQTLWGKIYQKFFLSFVHGRPVFRWKHQLSHRKLLSGEKISFEILLPYEKNQIEPFMKGRVSS